MPEERCPHLRIGSVPVSARLCLAALQVPEYHCDLGGTILPRAADAGPAIAYGPDGQLVSRETCSMARCEQRCRPVLADTTTAPAANTASSSDTKTVP